MTEQSMRAELVRADPKTGELALDQRSIGANAAAVKAKTEVEAPYALARAYPRSWLDVRTRLMKELERPGFARACVYAREQGGSYDRGQWVPNYVQGLSIRFAEASLALGGNMRAGSEILFDDEEKRIYRVYAVDLETNAIEEATAIIEKTVERGQKAAEYRTILRERANTKGEIVYICQATEDEIQLKANNAINKQKRNAILSLVPPDIKDEFLARAKQVRDANIAADPHAEAKALADGFAKLSVMPKDLAEYLGHDIEQCSPAELGMLRGLYMAIDGGEATWPELVKEKAAPPEQQVKTTRAKKLADELRAKKEAAAKEAEAKKANASTSAAGDKKPEPAKK